MVGIAMAEDEASFPVGSVPVDYPDLHFKANFASKTLRDLATSVIDGTIKVDCF